MKLVKTYLNSYAFALATVLSAAAREETKRNVRYDAEVCVAIVNVAIRLCRRLISTMSKNSILSFFRDCLININLSRF